MLGTSPTSHKPTSHYQHRKYQAHDLSSTIRYPSRSLTQKSMAQRDRPPGNPVLRRVPAVPEAATGVLGQWYQRSKLGCAFKLWSYSLSHSATPPNILLINPFSSSLSQNWVLLPSSALTGLLPVETGAPPRQEYLHCLYMRCPSTQWAFSNSWICAQAAKNV